ncbi:Uncharacterised protein [Mycobacteroides abscessus subsp. abscessus]|uniref:hypothetical protein n=1 Tax=Mycobacteroides abscessus TaxID=36809 RepID=UPI000927C6BB|nr:hypothetical protein [Mycobacteroides abscessus]SIC62863.1 Uncharacterised protein [Mycobacteroides abscessus subsp. abscessus]SIG63655.1 Uncharacterised protein [Mycobacteroides abscessus subsp. abscessus]
MIENVVLAVVTLTVALGIAWWVNRSHLLAPRTVYAVSLTVWAVVLGAMMW